MGILLDPVSVTILLALSRVLAIATVNIIPYDLKAQLFLSFYQASLLKFGLFFVEEEDFLVATLEQNELVNIFFVRVESSWIWNVERISAEEALLICKLPEGYNAEFLCIPSTVRFLLMKLAISTLN